MPLLAVFHSLHFAAHVAGAIQIEKCGDHSGDGGLQERPPAEFLVHGQDQVRIVFLRILQVLTEMFARKFQPAVGHIVHLAVGHLHVAPRHRAVHHRHAAQSVRLDDRRGIGCRVAGVLEPDALMDGLAHGVDESAEDEDEEEDCQRGHDHEPLVAAEPGKSAGKILEQFFLHISCPPLRPEGKCRSCTVLPWCSFPPSPCCNNSSCPISCSRPGRPVWSGSRCRSLP